MPHADPGILAQLWEGTQKNYRLCFSSRACVLQALIQHHQMLATVAHVTFFSLRRVKVLNSLNVPLSMAIGIPIES